MKQAEEKAAAKAELEKAAEEAEVVKAAEEQELQQKKAEVQAVVQGVTTGAERLMADLETRVSEKQEDLGKVVDELRSKSMRNLKRFNIFVNQSEYLVTDKTITGKKHLSPTWTMLIS